MALSKIQAESMNLADTYAFSGTVTGAGDRSEEHTSELQSRSDLVCRLLLEKKKTTRQERRNSEI